MKHIFFGFLLALIILSCNQRSQGPTSLTHFISEDSHTIIRINDLESFKADLNNNEIISKVSYLNNLEKNISLLSKLKTNNPILITLGDSGFDHRLITKYSDSLFGSVSVDSMKIGYQVIDSILIASSTDEFNKVQLKKNINPEFNKIYNTSDTGKSFSLYFNNHKTQNLSNSFFNLKDLTFSNWISLDIEIISEEGIKISGIATSTDTINKGMFLFKNSLPQENTLIDFSPANIDNLKTISFSDSDIFEQNLRQIAQKQIDSIEINDLLATFNEVGVISINDKKAMLVNSIDGNSTNDLLAPSRNIIEDFREIPIYELDSDFDLKDNLSPILDIDSFNNYIRIDNYFAFSNSIETLKAIISSNRNRNTLGKNYNFRQNEAYVSNESSLLEIVNKDDLPEKLQAIFGSELSSSNFDKYEKSVFQLIQDDGFTHINAIIQKGSSRVAQTGVNEVFSTQLESDLITSPQFVVNHRTKQKEVVVQDLNNNLYLISNRGRILWKKKLQGKILGEIEQVDLYKNGRLQLAFATPNRVYILDRNGNDVSPFPLRFRDDITQPLSVFDYDNRRDYRFLVTQGKNLLMYNRRGQAVGGFNYRESKNITTQPKHFRISNKDYIVFISENEMKILNRRGQNRINVKEQVAFSNNPIFNYRNTFTTTSNVGELIQVNLNGTVSKQNLKLASNHKIDATSKTLVTSFENQLNIKLKNYELDFGEYTKPKIFYLNDKIYIAITDLQASKVFLFDSQAKLLSYFPIYGNSTIDLENIDRDRNLEIVVQGESNSIIVYKMN